MKIIFLIILINFFLVAKSQSIYFNNHFIAPGAYWGSAKNIISYNNNYMFTGVGSGFSGNEFKKVIIGLMDGEGEIIDWKTYGEEGFHYYDGYYNSLIRTYENDFLMPVTVEQQGCLTSYLYCFNEYGDTIWSKKYGNSTTQDYCNTKIQNITQLNDSSLIMTGGQSPSDDEYNDILLLRTDKMGNEIWQNTYGSSYVDRGGSVIETSDTGFLVGGFKYLPGLDYSGDAVVLKTDIDGNLIWQKIFGGQFQDSEAKVLLAYDSNYIVGYGDALSEPVPGYAFRKMCFKKHDENGDIIWEKSFGGVFLGNYVAEIEPLEDGNYLAVGSSSLETNAWRVGWLLKFSDDGDSIWYRQYWNLSETDDNRLRDVERTPDKGFIMCGQVVTDNSQEMWVIKVDSMGCETPGCATGTQVFGIPPENKHGLLVWPNPATGYFNVFSSEFHELGSKMVQVYNSQGVKVIEIIVPELTQVISLDIETQPKGIYFIRLINNSEIIGIKRIVKL